MNRESKTEKSNPEAMYNKTDLLFLTDYISESVKEVDQDKANNYTKYHESKDAREVEKQKDNQPPQPPPPPLNVYRKRKIYLDTMFRDVKKYPDASDIKLSWGKTFTNVVSMKLNSMEFSNVSKVVTTKSNKLYWINKEDEDLDKPYPVYSADISPGSYTFTSIQTEIISKTNIIKRHNGLRGYDGLKAIFHFFKMDINEETDFVSFVSIIAKAAPANPLTTVSGDSLVIFQFPSHGFDDGEKVHIIGVRGVLGGIQAKNFNSSFIIKKINDDSFTFNISDIFLSGATGGGSLVKAGKESPFQFLSGGTYSDTISDMIGFRVENTSKTIPNSNPIKTKTVKIQSVRIGKITEIVATGHNLIPGDRIFLNNFHVTPSIYTSIHQGIFTVYSTPSPDLIHIRYESEFVTDVSEAFVGTQIFEMNFDNHGFNRITEVEQVSVNLVSITTLFPHGLVAKEIPGIRIAGTNSIPKVDAYYHSDMITITDLDSFTIRNPINVLSPEIRPLTISRSGWKGRLISNFKFFLYNVDALGGFTTEQLNAVQFEVRDILDANNFTFTGRYGFSGGSAGQGSGGGGSNIRINSKLHGWSGNHDNSPNGVLNKPVKLSGDNYAYLCINNLVSDSVATNSPVKNIFAKLFITANPGVIIFNQFDASEIEFENPIPKLDELHFQVRSPNGDLTSFGGLDYSFGLELTEQVAVSKL